MRDRGTSSPLGNAFIGIAGLIGAGKTTLATALAEHLGDRKSTRLNSSHYS